MNRDEKIESGHSETGVRGWIFVCALAIGFLIYGLFMFFYIGDKGPPDWGFGTVEDIPGQSIYSTSPAIRGPAAIPEPQHVFQKPSLAGTDASKEK